jgi:hypothetical protein
MNKKYALASVKVPDDEPADAFPGTFDVILSTPEMDRDGEVIEAKAFEPLPDHITFDVDHGMSTETTVGSGAPRYEDGVLKVAGSWSSLPRAQAVRTLVKEGHIRTTSVAYMGAQIEQKDGVPHTTKAELLNGAFVAIPSNRGARVLSAKDYREALDESGPVLPADGQIVKAVARMVESVSALARTSTKAPGLSANELRELIAGAVEKTHGGGRSWVWLRDYGDDWVVFSKEGDGATGLYRQGYKVDGSVVSLDGETESVYARTSYEPVTPTDSTDNAPKSAAALAATSSASVVTRALAAGEVALALYDYERGTTE